MPARSGDRALPGRRVVLAGLGSALATPLAAAAPVRLGILNFGSVQWLADVVHRHGFDAAHGFSLDTVTLANTDAGRIALMARTADIAVSDWFFVAARRADGTPLAFAPFSSASGGIMVPADSAIHGLTDLADRRIGVAGGPFDKSWLLVRAAAQSRHALDLSHAAQVTYAAPPLLNAALQRGTLDAVLTYWNFAARLEAAGFRQVVSVGDCALSLGISDRLSLIGFVFHTDWATQNPRAIDGFLAAATDAQALLAQDAAEWNRLRPLMDAPDDALFNALRRRFVDGSRHAPRDRQQRDAAKLFEIVRRTGGAGVTDGLEALPDGVFWPPRDG
jgi:NitT/TauT family transport system substrate-binding protein